MKLFRGKALKVLLALTMAVPVSTVWLAPAVQAEGANDTAPFINAKIVNENAGKKVLFDNTHGQTAGAADWVIDGGFSDFGNALATAGFYVKELRKTTPITLTDLQQYDVFVIGEANIPYKPAEQDALLQYVQGGGSIFFIADHYNADRNKNRWDASEVMNGYRRGAWANPTQGMSADEAASGAMAGVQSSDWLGQNFGVRFRYNALADIGATNIVAPEQSFGITQGVTEVAMHAGSTLAIMDPNKAKGLVYLPQTSAAWGYAVDQGVYNGGGVAEGPFSAISKVGLGKAAFIGDSSPVEDSTPKYLKEEDGKVKGTYDGWKEVNDATYLTNVVNWLSKKESYTSLAEVPDLQLDEPTVLLPMETPETSTEPQVEPWAVPSATYKWWDSSTFKPGSYGGANAVNPAFTYVHQATLPNAEDFQIRFQADSLIPNSTVTGYTLGIYNSSAQVAKFQNDDGTWPANYGYSTSFSLKADANGHASKDFNVRINPSVSGAANLRLKVNGSNNRTEAVTIGTVPAEPLPAQPAPEQPTIPAKISVAEARTKAENTLVTIEGVVTTKPSIYGGQAFYLQDETGGVYVYQTTTGYQVGDQVSVSANTQIYNQELELSNPLDIHKTGTADVPQPVVVTALSDQNQAQLVKLEDVTVQNVVASGTFGTFEFDAVRDTNTTHVRVDNRTGLTKTDFDAKFQAGDHVNITGISSITLTSQANPTGYLLRTHAADAIEAVPVPDPTPTPKPKPKPEPDVDWTPAPEVKIVTVEKNGNTAKASVNEQKLEEAINSALQTGKGVLLDVTGSGDNVATELNAAAFQTMTDKLSDSVLQVKTDAATLSLKAASVKKEIEKLGLTLSDSKVSVSINKLDNTLAQANNLNNLINPLSIKVEVTAANGQTYAIEQALKPTVTLPSTASTVASKNLAGVMIDPQTKEVFPVPTLFNTADGTTQATFQTQRNNLVYTIVQNDKSFTDVATNSYGKDAINTLANKLVVSGVTDTTFNPTASINRGDFAVLLLRGLGINADKSATSTFKDVQADAYYAANVEAARQLGLISGYEDGTFRPTQEISRQEMAAMIYRAMQLSGSAKTLTDAEKQQQLATFHDGSNISDWAKEAAAFAISQGIILGTDAGQFSPDTLADREQSATILFRTLASMNYLN